MTTFVFTEQTDTLPRRATVRFFKGRTSNAQDRLAQAVKQTTTKAQVQHITASRNQKTGQLKRSTI
ncbi:MAG: hypothetical protein U1D69_02220 [Polynucleobacter sp.]|nr:hypothetical protein [Polynucleobacter sp.]